MSNFSIDIKDLSEIVNVQLTREERNNRLRQFGGIEKLCEHLKVDCLTGLLADNEDDLEARRRSFGSNELKIIKPKSFLYLIWLAYHDNLLIVLTICAFISIGLSFFNIDTPECYSKEHKPNILSEWIDGIAILIAVLIVLLVTAFNNWTKEKQFRNLQMKLEQEHKINVIRDAEIKEIPIKNLLVGDICVLNIGNLVPADGVVLRANDLKIDESNITGESELIEKNTHDSILFNGTKVMNGTARMLITSVGPNTQSGIIMTTLKTIKKETVKSESILQTKLTKLSIQIGYAGIMVSLATFFVLVIRFFITESDQLSDYRYVIQQIIDYLIISISILVLAIPEGLPLAVTISLAYAVRKMIDDHNLVRHLDACETMGSATTVCTDKTGTLTTNQMTVTEIYINGALYDDMSILEKLDPITKELLSHSISINTSPSSRLIPTEIQPQIGNKTDCSLLALVSRLGYNYEAIRRDYSNERIMHIHTFSSDRKYMATTVNYPRKRIYVKGASERMINKCSFVLFNDEITPIYSLKPHIIDAIKHMSRSGLRTLMIAFKDLDTEREFDFIEDENDIINELVFVCLCGIEDPVRKEVPNAISKCKSAGIIVRMVTGDNIDTARSIAIKCGIIGIDNNFLVLDSKEFNFLIRNISGQIMQDKFDLVWPHLRVLARATPQDKYILVKHIISSRLDHNREVVAVTGDGTNDGPALKMADVGFAMGIQGTDVAKEASDIILTDDNFDSIVRAVMWGRNVHDSVAKFIQFQLTVNIIAVLAEFFGACIGKKPLNGVQMLWINLIMDSLASLALATDLPTENLLQRKPYKRTSPIISKTMIKNIFFQCVYQLSVIIFILLKGPNFIELDKNAPKISLTNSVCARKLHQPSEHLTLVLNTFVLMTLFNEINSRKIHGEHNIFEGLLKNPIFCTIWLVTLGIQILMVNYGGYAFAVKPLNLQQWSWCIIFGLGTIVFQQLIAMIPTEKLPEKQIDIKKLKKYSPKEVNKTNHAKILWLRGFNKLRAVTAFDHKHRYFE